MGALRRAKTQRERGARELAPAAPIGPSAAVATTRRRKAASLPPYRQNTAAAPPSAAQTPRCARSSEDGAARALRKVDRDAQLHADRTEGQGEHRRADGGAGSGRGRRSAGRGNGPEALVGRIHRRSPELQAAVAAGPCSSCSRAKLSAVSTARPTQSHATRKFCTVDGLSSTKGISSTLSMPITLPVSSLTSGPASMPSPRRIASCSGFTPIKVWRPPTTARNSAEPELNSRAKRSSAVHPALWRPPPASGRSGETARTWSGPAPTA